jgi:DsbC/DsbD-like thiol-disulfide interchange protein
MILFARVFVLSLMACMAVFGPPALAADASGWVEGHRSRVRLIAGEAAARERWAGIEIALDPGFKTYWRNPGESGLPPSFDWSRSANVETIELLWPAPTRLKDGGGVFYGYAGGVVFPVRVIPRDPNKPVRLTLTIDYGVCKDICIPAQADLSLDLAVQSEDSFAALIRQTRARVPRRQALGAEGDLSILGVEPVRGGGKPQVKVSVRAPAGMAPHLFAEGPDGWFLATSEAMIPATTDTANKSGAFLVEIDPPPNGGAGAVPLRLTLVAGDRAVETVASLDASQMSR